MIKSFLFRLILNFNILSKINIYIFILTLTINCSSTVENINNIIKEEESLSSLLNNKMPEGYDLSKTIRIYFATNRKTVGAPICGDTFYSIQSDTELRFGICDVNVPFFHDIGNLDFDPAKGRDLSFLFQYHKLINKDLLLSSLGRNPSSEIIVFVHGFNVKFEEAILRSAQIKYDLKFSGDVVLYTWPAGAEEGLLNKFLINDTYNLNFQNAKNSRAYFKTFFLNILESKKKVHLIVHSMGHQVVIPVINEIYREKNNKFIEELVLNAPDYDSREFMQIVNNLKSSSRRITVYCSPGDNALVASSKVNSNKRVGSCEKINGIDMINVNPVDAPFLGIGGLGHGYYSSRPVLTDLFQVILGIDAPKRLFIRQSSQDNAENYVLRR